MLKLSMVECSILVQGKNETQTSRPAAFCPSFAGRDVGAALRGLFPSIGSSLHTSVQGVHLKSPTVHAFRHTIFVVGTSHMAPQK